MFSSGVILSGATTSTNLFFRRPPVSFYLAQCDDKKNVIFRLQSFKKLPNSSSDPASVNYESVWGETLNHEAGIVFLIAVMVDPAVSLRCRKKPATMIKGLNSWNHAKP
jgi:hypothetical protein